MRTAWPVVALFAFLVFPAPAAALPVTLNFDELSPLSQLTDAYGTQDVLFQGVTVLSEVDGGGLDIFEYAPHSGSNVLGADLTTVIIDFLVPVSSFMAYFTYSGPVEIFASFGGEQLTVSTISAFDQNILSSGNPINELLGLNGLFDQIRIVGSGEFGGFTMDSVTFDTVDATVPEPATLSLMGIGVAAAFVRRRRQKK